MIDPALECARELRAIKTSLQQLMLVSHANSQSFNPAPAVEPQPSRWRVKSDHAPVPHIGSHHVHAGDSHMPSDGIKRNDDRQFDFRQKSHVFFETRLERWDTDRHRVYGLVDLEQLNKEITDTIHDWKHTPDMPGGLDPDRHTFLWRCMIADAPGTAKEVATKYAVSARTVERYRAQYRGIRKKAA